MSDVRTRRDRLRKSLRASVAEGMAAELVGAFAGAGTMTAWALHLGASTLVTGLLVALPVAAQVMHFPGAWLVGRVGARRVAIRAVTASRQVLWIVALLPILPERTREPVLLLVAGVSAALSIVGNNAWQTWMADLVPARLRGRYFGHRTGLGLFAGALGSLGAGVLLDLARLTGHKAGCLSLLTVGACVAGLVATFLMRRQHEPDSPRGRVPPGNPLAPFADPRVRRLLAFLVPWSFAIGLSSSYFTLFELREMRLSFALVASLTVLTAAVRLVSSRVWGRAIDRVGVRPVLVALSYAIVLVPIPWILADAQTIWPVVLDAVLTGLLWSGHGLATSQLPIRLAAPAVRSHVIAACSACSGLAFGLAAFLGGLVASALPHEGIVISGRTILPLQLLFLGSAALRLVAATRASHVDDPRSQPVAELGRHAFERARARLVGV